ncbi:hypothetical protein AXG93_3891s1190 [Marchantia polymorpha subsp. ruderalis]|uniref:Uncharacterized protein n=1 Tax=Marchantia polymorpha subsp. ruderalis TaxID=1480154 RepID=A0A176WP35_MARPO|nr:hypothetical protein AXG93_3891s1190 [Marchantia polymorpha subsp. ruderalis]
MATRVPCLQVVRPVSSQNASQYSGSFAGAATGRHPYSRKIRVVCSATEDYSPAKQKFDLPLSPEETSRGSDDFTETNSSTGKFDQEKMGTVSEVFQGAVKAVKDAPAITVAQMLLFGGVATFGLIVSGSMMESVALLPFAPEALQTVGVAYSVLLASQVLQGRSVSFPPPSPFKAVIQLVDNGQTPTPTSGQEQSQIVSYLQDALAMQKLVKERDAAVSQMEEMRKTAVSYARVVSEKEALEAVSLQLADERDGAVSEVSALKDAVIAMTNRMRAIEEMLDQEVSLLKKQNEALETVALQLAAERDSALQEVEDLKLSSLLYEEQREQMECLETVGVQLAQERDTALAEIEELKKVVASIREAASTASGLTTEQELFIEARVRALRSQFIDVDRGYDEQKDEVDRFIGHLVQEYGAPQEWTNAYIRQFLDTSATKSKLGDVAGDINRLESSTSQRSFQ